MQIAWSNYLASKGIPIQCTDAGYKIGPNHWYKAPIRTQNYVKRSSPRLRKAFIAEGLQQRKARAKMLNCQQWNWSGHEAVLGLAAQQHGGREGCVREFPSR